MKHSIFKRIISFMLAVLMVFSSATVDVSATTLGEGQVVTSDDLENASGLVEEILSQIEGTESAEMAETEVTESETSVAEEVEVNDKHRHKNKGNE